MANEYFLYARKSTESEDRQIRSIEAQLTELRVLAQKENITIKQEFTEAMTAKVPGRPIFNEMISRIEKGEAQGIIAWHPDRLARNSVDGGRIIYLLDTEHLKFLKFSTFWFESTPQGKFMLQIAFGQSKYYVDNLSENVRRGNRQKLRRGEWPGRAPLGYINDKANRKVVADPIRAPAIVKLFEACAEGKYTLKQLTDMAPGIGLVSRHKNNFHGKVALFWIQKILTNPFYYGLMCRAGESFEGKHEPIITKELFDRAQEALAKRSKNYTLHKYHFPFVGLLKCASCNCSITAQRQKGHHYYSCTKKREKCPEPYIREELLAEQISQALQKIAVPDGAFQELMAYWAKDQAEASQPVALLKEQLSTEIPQITSKIDKLLDAHLEGLVSKSEFQAKKEALLRRKIALQEKIAQLEQGATGWLEPLKEFLQAAHHAGFLAEGENLEAKKDFFKKIGLNPKLAAKTLSFSYAFPWALLAKSRTFTNWWARQGLNL